MRHPPPHNPPLPPPASPGKLLSGKLAVITGGGTGIGAACAEVLAEAGCHVVVTGRNLATLEPIAAQTGGSAIPCDVTVHRQVVALFQQAKKITGAIDILVNNAGVPGPLATVADVDLDHWRACVEVNLFGALSCLQESAKIMREQRSGSIINLSSLMGVQGYPMRSAYCASKFALVGITEAMARELGDFGVRVNALLPGAVAGENMQRIVEKRAAAEGRPVAEIVAQHYTNPAALNRWVDPKEVARAVLFYASDLSSAITGDKMRVDCGRF